MCRLMAHFKSFVKRRVDPIPNLVSSISLATLIRRCPSGIRAEIDALWSNESEKIYARQLQSVAYALEEKRHGHGTGRLVVLLKQRNHKQVYMTDLTTGFKNFMVYYNRRHEADFRFNLRYVPNYVIICSHLCAQYVHNCVPNFFWPTCRRCLKYVIKTKQPGVTLDGRELRVNGNRAIMWQVQGHNRGAHDCVATIMGMIYLLEGDREIIIFKVVRHTRLNFINWARIYAQL